MCLSTLELRLMCGGFQFRNHAAILLQGGIGWAVSHVCL